MVESNEVVEKSLGEHIFIDLYGCNSDLLNDPEVLLSIMRTAVQAAHATEMKSMAYRVGTEHNPNKRRSPEGVSVLVGLDESHITCHTYAKAGMAALDIFTCGETAKPQSAVNYLVNNIPHTHKEVSYHKRFLVRS